MWTVYVTHVFKHMRVTCMNITEYDRFTNQIVPLKMRDSTEASVSIDTMRCRVEGSGIVIGFLLD